MNYSEAIQILTNKDEQQDFTLSGLSSPSYNTWVGGNNLFSLSSCLVTRSYVSYPVLTGRSEITDTTLVLQTLCEYSSNTYVRKATSEHSKLYLKKNSSDTSSIDLEHFSDEDFILYKVYSADYEYDTVEGNIFYFFTEEHNPIVDDKCVMISNSKTDGLSKSIVSLSNLERTDKGYSFIDPHINNLVYKSDLPVPINNIVDGSSVGSVRTINSAAEGSTYALGEYAFSEGEETKASGRWSHAEGLRSTASERASHAEGSGTTASGTNSHAECQSTTASGTGSHAEGRNTVASGHYSHAEGDGTVAQGTYQHVQGKYNIEDTTSAHILGNGDSMTKSNAHTIDWSGNAWFAGDVYVKSTSGTNKDSGSKKLATEEYVTNLVGDVETILTTLTTGSGV